jgi:tripartite-type tricarboxylate transporter receptor subunit TctC
MNRPLVSIMTLVLSALSTFLVSGQGFSQTFPDRPIKVIVPFPAGGPVDTLARSLGQGFQQRTGQQFIVESRPGANTSLGGLACKQSPPDGYTLCLLASTTVSLNPHLYKDLRYTPADLAPVTNIAVSRAAFLVHKSVPVTTVAEFVAWSKKHPDKMNYASFGVGSETHLMVEWFKKQTGAQMTHVPFQGFAPAIQAFDRGDIQVMIPVIVPPILHRIQTKEANPLFILNDNRAANIPDTPSARDIGLPPIGFETWFGMFTPAGTPMDRIEKLSEVLRSVVADKEFSDKILIGAGLVPSTNTPQAFKTFLETDFVKAGELVKTSGVTLATQ